MTAEEEENANKEFEQGKHYEKEDEPAPEKEKKAFTAYAINDDGQSSSDDTSEDLSQDEQ